MKRASTLSPAQLRVVHVNVRQAGLSDEDYRALLMSRFGVRSSKDLQQREFEILVAELKERGGSGLTRGGTMVASATPPGAATNQQIWKVKRLCEQIRLDPSGAYFRGIMRKSGAADRIAWLTREQAAKLIDALTYIARHQSQSGGRAPQLTADEPALEGVPE